MNKRARIAAALAFMLSAAHAMAQGIDLNAFNRGAQEAQQANHTSQLQQLQLLQQQQQLQLLQQQQQLQLLQQQRQLAAARAQRQAKEKAELNQYGEAAQGVTRDWDRFGNWADKFFIALHSACPRAPAYYTGMPIGDILTTFPGILAANAAIDTCEHSNQRALFHKERQDLTFQAQTLLKATESLKAWRSDLLTRTGSGTGN